MSKRHIRICEMMRGSGFRPVSRYRITTRIVIGHRHGVQPAQSGRLNFNRSIVVFLYFIFIKKKIKFIFKCKFIFLEF